MSKPITDFGKARANKFARVANSLKLSDTCECTDAPVCQDTIPSVANFTSIVVDGTTYHVNTPVYDGSGELIWNPTRMKSFYDSTDSTDAAYFESFIYAVLSMYEVDSFVSVDPDNEQTIHIGAYELTITGNTTTRCCTVVDNAFNCA